MVDNIIIIKLIIVTNALQYKKIMFLKVLMQVVYTLRTYWNQFSLGEICKQK